VLHIDFLSPESSTPRRLMSEQLLLPGMAAPQTVRILPRWLPAEWNSGSPVRSIRLRRDTLVAAHKIVERAPGQPESPNREMEHQRIKRLVIATALAMESGVPHV